MSDTQEDRFVEVPAGTAVFQAGETGAALFIVESGQVDLLAGEGTQAIIASLGPGEFFGESALLEGQPHPFAAVASTRSRLLRIERAAFRDIVRQIPDIAIQVLRQVAARQPRLLAARRVAVPVEPKEAPAPIEPTPAAEPSSPQRLALRVAGQMLPLDPSRSEWLVGRPDPASGIAPDVDLGPFDGNRTLSRRHARILHEGGLYFLREEPGVANGTHVNGVRVASGVKVPIQPGDKLRFGLIEVEVVGA
jgi:CRP-like cAMP-binding protein